MNNLKYAAALALAAISLPSQAATLFSGGSTGPLATPDSFGFTAASGATTGVLSFTIDGFNSLDGVNFYEDDFTLSLKRLGDPPAGLRSGRRRQQRHLLQPRWRDSVGSLRGRRSLGDRYRHCVAAVAGRRKQPALFYDSPLGDALGATGGHAGPQGIGDEAWGLSNISLTGQAITAVPEPASWALMIGGFGLLGAVMRRRSVPVRFA